MFFPYVQLDGCADESVVLVSSAATLPLPASCRAAAPIPPPVLAEAIMKTISTRTATGVQLLMVAKTAGCSASVRFRCVSVCLCTYIYS